MEYFNNYGKHLLYKLSSIALVWIGLIGITVFWSWVFNGGYFLIRLTLTLPFTISAISATQMIWRGTSNSTLNQP